jgi:hypothetical protein
MTLQDIVTTLENQIQNNQLVLTSSTLELIPFNKFLTILNIEQFALRDAEINISANNASLTGKTSLLGVENAGLAIMFTETDNGLSSRLSAMLPIAHIPGATWLSLENVQLELNLSAGTNQVTGTIAGILRSENIDAIDVILTIDAATETTWQTEISRLRLSAIAQTFLAGVSRPAELPDFELTMIGISITPATGMFALQATTSTQWDFGTGSDELGVQVALMVNRTAMSGTSQIDASLSIIGEGPLAIANELALSNFSLNFTLEGGDWSLSGEVVAELFEQMLRLSAAYHQMNDTRTFMLMTTTTAELVNVTGVGSFSITGLAIALNRQFIEGQTTATSTWQVSADGAMRVDSVFDFQGNLTLAREEETARLVFMPNQATVTIPLPPDQRSSMNLEFGGISIVRRNPDPSTPNRTAWMFAASVSLTFSGWHPSVQRVLPDRINATFTADNDSVRLSAERVVAPFDFAIPDIEIDNNTRIPLGTARIDVSDLAILFANEIELSARIGVGLPENLNNLFGREADGTPTIRFFNTFDPRQPEDTVVQLELAINAVSGIRLTPRTSIITAVRLQEENGETFWYLELGGFGEVKFRVPIFSYDSTTSSFRASGGFEVVQDLSLPLTPAKLLLNATGLNPIADTLPDGVPLQPIQILDNQGNFRVDELVSILNRVSGAELPDEVMQALRVIGDRLDQLPDSFRQYLNIQIPDSFFFDIAVTPTGEVRLEARVNEGDPPIRFLFSDPTFPNLNPIPSISGIELRSLSFGTLSGGSLFLLEVDANVDQFDLLTLAGALLLPDNDSIPLPNSRELHRRLILHKLFMLIVYQTGIPIPIPMFYDEIGIEYLGLEGVNFETHAQFPMPSLNLAEVGQILSNFRQFFSDHNFLLNPDDAPTDVNLRFTLPLSGNFLQLPEYLGSQRLGSTASGIEIDAYRNLANLLNGLKTLSVNRLIQAMPLEYRVNSVGLDFGPAAMNAGWLITTPDEFRQIATQAASRQMVYNQLGFANDQQANAALAVIPTPRGSRNDEGLVVLMRGNWNVTNVAMLDAVFGLAASGSEGFVTGFRITGAISNILDLEMAGSVAINTPTSSMPTAPTSSQTASTAYALAFNGQNNYVRLNNPASLNFTGQITIEAWVRPEVTDGLRNIVAHGFTRSPNGEVFLRIGNGSYQIGSWDGQEYLTSAAIPAEDIGNWVHLAGLYDGMSWRLYRNGVEVNANQAARGAIAVSENWAIGARGTGTERFFQGQIQDVRIWNRALSNGEIRMNMSRRLRGDEPGLVGYWQLNEGQGTVANDLTGNGNAGTIQGAQWQRLPASILTPLPDNASSTIFQLMGRSFLSILNRQIFNGDIQIVNDQFRYRGELSLFPQGFPLQVNGHLEGVLSNSDFHLAGNVNTSLAGFDLVNARAIVDNNRLSVQGNWLGVMTTLNVNTRNQLLLLEGTVGVNLWGLQANLSVEIDNNRRAMVQGTIQGLSVLNGAFQLSGAGGRPNPAILLRVSPQQPLTGNISGAIRLLGIASETQIAVGQNQFFFRTEGRLFNAFQSVLEVQGQQLNNAANFRVAGRMQNDLFQYLNRETSRAIQAAVDTATAGLSRAEMDVQNAQDRVNQLDMQITTQRNVVRQERESAVSRLRDARAAVNRAQQDLDNIDRDIQRLQNDLNRERNNQVCIGSLCVPRRPDQIIRLEGELRSRQAGRPLAEGTLRGTQETLRLLEREVATFPIDADPRVATLLTARASANGSLIALQGTLETIRASVGAFASVSDFIQRNGLNNLLDVRSASFDTSLNSAAGGMISLSLSLVYLNQSRNVNLAFDFTNPLNSARALARLLLSA